MGLFGGTHVFVVLWVSAVGLFSLPEGVGLTHVHALFTLDAVYLEALHPLFNVFHDQLVALDVVLLGLFDSDVSLLVFNWLLIHMLVPAPPRDSDGMEGGESPDDDEEGAETVASVESHGA